MTAEYDKQTSHFLSTQLLLSAPEIMKYVFLHCVSFSVYFLFIFPSYELKMLAKANPKMEQID